MAVLSNSYRIVLNISSTTTSRTHILPSTYPSIPHANAAVQGELQAWAPDHLRMTTQSLTEQGTWEFEFVCNNRTEEVFVEAIIEKVDEMDVDEEHCATKHEEEMHDSMTEGDGNAEKKGKKRTQGLRRTLRPSTRSRSTASESGVSESTSNEGRVLRKMPRRKAKGRNVGGEEEE